MTTRKAIIIFAVAEAITLAIIVTTIVLRGN
jgi:hypothetical protein